MFYLWFSLKQSVSVILSHTLKELEKYITYVTIQNQFLSSELWTSWIMLQINIVFDKWLYIVVKKQNFSTSLSKLYNVTFAGLLF